MDGIKGVNQKLAPQGPEKKTNATSLKPESDPHSHNDHASVRTDFGAMLADIDWRKISLMLHAHADFLMRHKLGVSYGEISMDGVEPADFAQNAIHKLFTGQRRWNPVRCPDLMMFLRGIVRSDLSDAMRKYARTDVRLNTSFALPERLQAERDLLHAPASDSPLEIAQLLKEIKAEVEQRNDPVLNECWNAFLHGTGKPSDLSEELNLPVARIYNAQRRLRGLFRRYKP